MFERTPISRVAHIPRNITSTISVHAHTKLSTQPQDSLARCLLVQTVGCVAVKVTMSPANTLRNQPKLQGYVLSDSEIETLVLKIDSNNDGNIVLSEFMTTLIDWNQLQKDQGWQVRNEPCVQSVSSSFLPHDMCGWSSQYLLPIITSLDQDTVTHVNALDVKRSLEKGSGLAETRAGRSQ